MSSIDDLSRISGLSNISRISKLNNSTVYKFDSTCNLSEWQSKCKDVTKSFSIDSQKTESKRLSESAKVNKALNSCDKSTCDYAKLKLIYDCLEEIVNNESKAIETETIKKLKEFMTIHKVKKYLHLPNNSKDIKEELTLLGIIDLPQHEFSYEEQLAIKSCLEAKLRDKIHSFLTTYENLAGSTRDVMKNSESMIVSRFQQKGELENLHWKEKIDEVCLEYRRDLIHCNKMLLQWKDLQSKVNAKYTEDAESLLLQLQLAEMKASITKLSCILRMYKETDITIDAFKILSNSLDEKIANVSDEITEKMELKKAYDALNSSEYNDILRKYLEVCHVIKKKRILLDKL